MLDWSKLKAFADDTFNVATILSVIGHASELNVKGKGLT